MIFVEGYINIIALKKSDVDKSVFSIIPSTIEKNKDDLGKFLTSKKIF